MPKLELRNDINPDGLTFAERAARQNRLARHTENVRATAEIHTIAAGTMLHHEHSRTCWCKPEKNSARGRIWQHRCDPATFPEGAAEAGQAYAEAHGHLWPHG